MKQKLIAFAVIFAMLASLSPAVAADEMSATPTVEEILDEYHQKAFNAQLQDDTNNTSTWSRRGGEEKTLEQETIEILTEAGYEAYNVTAENYEELENELKTDFAEMGLDPNGSYIVVVEGEDLPNTQNDGSNSKPSPETNLQGPDWLSGSGSTFKYYDGQNIYTMRYVIITEADAPGLGLFDEDSYILSNVPNWEDIATVISDYVVTAMCDKMIAEIVDEIPIIGTICSVATLLGELYEIATQDPLQPLDPGTLVFRAGVAWTHNYIQVYNEDTSYWHTSQCSTYAIVRAHFDGEYVYDPVTNAPMQVGGILQDTTIYSPYYENSDERKDRAFIGYTNDYVLFDGTGDIDIYFTNPNDPNPETNKIHLFSFTQCLAYLIEYKQPG